ncbi:MAG: thiamine phosphate synthase [Gammaproteobacteria bacterium]|nr:thiamine phosphate synthase [Gammaproteobacteria bacterium]
MNTRLRGLYAITDSALIAPDKLIEEVAQAIAGGAAVIQYRDKGTDAARRECEARGLLTLCRAHGVPLIINDDVALAAAIGADGVHLGRDDITLNEARRRLGTAALIGVSCYNDLARAEVAQAAGADYVAFGRFFGSHTKPNAVRAGVELLHQARQRLDIPVAAIGGITAENGAALIEASADMLAVIHGVFGQTDITGAARSIALLFKPQMIQL